MTDGPRGESVMAGHGCYSAHSAPQHSAAAPGLALLARAVEEVPLPEGGRPAVVGDYGCAGGANEMEPVRVAVTGLRRRDPSVPIEVLHTDLPTNDFASLLTLLDDPGRSYLAGVDDVFPLVAGRSLYGPIQPAGSLTLGWTAITVHWLSQVPGTVASAVYPNLTSADERRRLARRSAEDWEAFLRHRSHELVPGGQVVVVGGASADDGLSGAEGLFTMVAAELDALAAAGDLRAGEREAMFYPTYNRTTEEFLAPLRPGGSAVDHLELLDHRLDAIDDADTHPQWSRDGDADAFAAAYTPFVRAVTEPSFFRWLTTTGARRTGPRWSRRPTAAWPQRIAADPAAATCRWHTVSLRVRRR